MSEHNPKLVVIRFAAKKRKYHYFHFFEGRTKISTERTDGDDTLDHQGTIDALSGYFKGE